MQYLLLSFLVSICISSSQLESSSAWQRMKTVMKSSCWCSSDDDDAAQAAAQQLQPEKAPTYQRRLFTRFVQTTTATALALSSATLVPHDAHANRFSLDSDDDDHSALETLAQELASAAAANSHSDLDSFSSSNAAPSPCLSDMYDYDLSTPQAREAAWRDMLTWLDTIKQGYTSLRAHHYQPSRCSKMARLLIQGKYQPDTTFRAHKLHLAEADDVDPADTAFAHREIQCRFISAPDRSQHTYQVMSFALCNVTNKEHSQFLQTPLKLLIETVRQHQPALDAGEVVTTDFYRHDLALELRKAEYTNEEIYHCSLQHKPRQAAAAAVAAAFVEEL